MIKAVKDKAEKAWSTTKKLMALMTFWGLVFSLVTVTHLGVAFDYDDTLVVSGPAYAKAFKAVAQPYSPEFWAVVNQSYDLERPKKLIYPLAWLFRIFGFRVTVLTTRPPVQNEALLKEWRHLISRGNFIFAGEAASKHAHLLNGNYVLFFGDSDNDIAEARKAKVFPVRVRRSPGSLFKTDYNPGSLREFVIPFSEY
jgi:acid phosphatase (class B)